jgi:hypothetical protein
VLRVRRDLFSSSDVGGIVLSRQATGGSGDFNRVAGVDANFRFFKSLSLNGFAARSDSPAPRPAAGEAVDPGNRSTGKVSVGWEDSKKRLQYSLMSVGKGFTDDMGFVRRKDVVRHFVDWASFLQPASLRRFGIRQIEPHARAFHYHTPQGDLVTRQGHVAMQLTWNSGSRIEYAFEPRVEAISRPFEIQSGVVIPVGRYDWNQHLWVIETDHSRALSLSTRITHGDFWSGRQKNVQSSLLFRPNYRLFLDVGLQVTDIELDLPKTSFVTTLVNWRTGYSFNTNMFLDALVQYRSDIKQFSANLRFNLIHRPLSDFFVVYNEQQFTQGEVAAGRGVVVKFTRLFSF